MTGMTPSNDENCKYYPPPPLDGGGLRGPPAQRASGSERGGHGMVPLTPALSRQGRGDNRVIFLVREEQKSRPRVIPRAASSFRLSFGRLSFGDIPLKVLCTWPFNLILEIFSSQPPRARSDRNREGAEWQAQEQGWLYHPPQLSSLKA